jgi:release factor glutamine methyltransferase
LVETVLRLRPAPARIVDVGTGSGAIAVMLGALAADISPDALAVARSNGAHPLVQADLLSCFADSVFDCVVSNPPYVALTDCEGMQREVRDFEPHLALFAGSDGLDVYRRLIPQAWRVLKPGGLLALEFGMGQADAVTMLLEDWGDVHIYADLAGIPRGLTCEKPPATLPR